MGENEKSKTVKIAHTVSHIIVCYDNIMAVSTVWEHLITNPNAKCSIYLVESRICSQHKFGRIQTLLIYRCYLLTDR